MDGDALRGERFGTAPRGGAQCRRQRLELAKPGPVEVRATVAFAARTPLAVALKPTVAAPRAGTSNGPNVSF